MQSAYRGGRISNEAAPILAEYCQRLRLAELGYRFDPEDLDVFTAECFGMISAEIQKCTEKEMKKRG